MAHARLLADLPDGPWIADVSREFPDAGFGYSPLSPAMADTWRDGTDGPATDPKSSSQIMNTTNDRDDHDRDDHNRDGDSHEHEETAEPITDEIHDNSWSANLETPRHADDSELAIRDAFVAIDHTTPGNHVNLVTHGDLGHPDSFLYEAIRDECELDPEYVEQCGCGGHVTRVRVE